MNASGYNAAIKYVLQVSNKQPYEDLFNETEAYYYDLRNNPYSKDFPVSKFITDPNIVVLSHDDNGVWFLTKDDYNTIYGDIDLTKVNGTPSQIVDIVFPSSTQPTFSKIGKWDGSLNNELPNENGVFVFKDGSIYSGNLKNGSPEGRGKFFASPSFKNKTAIKYIDGQWLNGSLNGNTIVYFGTPVSNNQKSVMYYGIEGYYQGTKKMGVFYALDKQGNQISSAYPDSKGMLSFEFSKPTNPENARDITNEIVNAASFLAGGAIALTAIALTNSNTNSSEKVNIDENAKGLDECIKEVENEIKFIKYQPYDFFGFLNCPCEIYYFDYGWFSPNFIKYSDNSWGIDITNKLDDPHFYKTLKEAIRAYCEFRCK